MGLPNRYPIKRFFSNPEQTLFQVSPDGKHISYLGPWEKRLNIFVQPIDGGTAKRITEVRSRDILSYLWVAPDKLLYFQDKGGDENHHVFSVDIKGGEVKDLTPFDGAKAMFVDEFYNDDAHVFIQLNKRNAQVFDLYKLNFVSGELTMVGENPGHISSWLPDNQGKVRAAVSNNGVTASLLYRENEETDFEELISTHFKDLINPLFFDFDDRNMVVLSNLNRDKIAAVLYDPIEKKELSTIFEHPDVDIDAVSRSKKRKQLTSVRYTDWKLQRHFLDKELEQNFAEMRAQFPEMSIHVESIDRAEQNFILRVTSDRTKGTYYLYNTETKASRLLAEVDPELKAEDMAEMKPIAYTSRDGLKINGYLTLPPGRPAEKLPVVINPHGGPWYRDTWGFNPEIQFFANRGIAVLQINFRGSTGYGKDFWMASFKEWGGKMQDDVSDGVRWLIEQGVADPERIAIYGGSYGGYCTLVGLTHTPELYCCGVDFVGVSNLFTFMESFPPYWEPYLEMMYEMVGHPEKDKALLEAASPLFHIDRMEAPLFVAQGAQDPRVKQAESDQIVEALRIKGVEVAYLVKENEGHGFYNEENRLEFYEKTEEFLTRHLKLDQ